MPTVHQRPDDWISTYGAREIRDCTCSTSFAAPVSATWENTSEPVKRQQATMQS